MSFVCVILAHTDEAPPAFVYRCVCIEPLAFRRNRVSNWTTRLTDPINPLVREVGVIDHAVGHNVCPAAVLVDAAPDVVIGRCQVGDRAIGAASDEHVASALLRTPLQPVDVVAVNDDKTEAEALFSDRRSRDAGRPGAVWSADRHPTNLSLLRGGLAPALARSLTFGHLRTGLARFRETYGDRLLAARDAPPRAATLERAALAFPHRALDLLARFLAVLSHAHPPYAGVRMLDLCRLCAVANRAPLCDVARHAANGEPCLIAQAFGELHESLGV